MRGRRATGHAADLHTVCVSDRIKPTSCVIWTQGRAEPGDRLTGSTALISLLLWRRMTSLSLSSLLLWVEGYIPTSCRRRAVELRMLPQAIWASFLCVNLCPWLNPFLYLVHGPTGQCSISSLSVRSSYPVWRSKYILLQVLPCIKSFSADDDISVGQQLKLSVRD